MSVEMRHDPKTPEQWQEAVDMAAGWRMIEDCRMYGLIDGGPSVNLDRCDEILERGRKRGVRPSKPVLELAIDLVRACNSRGGETDAG